MLSTFDLREYRKWEAHMVLVHWKYGTQASCKSLLALYGNQSTPSTHHSDGESNKKEDHLHGTRRHSMKQIKRSYFLQLYEQKKPKTKGNVRT